MQLDIQNARISFTLSERPLSKNGTLEIYSRSFRLGQDCRSTAPTGVGLRLSARPSRNRACLTDASGDRADHPPLQGARRRGSRGSFSPPVDRHAGPSSEEGLLEIGPPQGSSALRRPSVDTTVTPLRNAAAVAVAAATAIALACVRNKHDAPYVHARARSLVLQSRSAHIGAAAIRVRARALGACVHLVYNCGARRTHDLYKIDTIVCSVG